MRPPSVEAKVNSRPLTGGLGGAYSGGGGGGGGDESEGLINRDCVRFDWANLRLKISEATWLAVVSIVWGTPAAAPESCRGSDMANSHHVLD